MGTETHTGFWWRKLKERNGFEITGVYGTITLKLILNK
jgi:hypothetical protein